MKKLLLFFSCLFILIGLTACGPGGLFCRHEFSENITASTCTEEGLNTRTCTLCGRVETKKIEKKAHDFSEFSVTREETCLLEGERKRSCSICGAEETEGIAKKEHSFSAWADKTPVGCTEDGEKTRTCTLCNTEESKITPKLGHSFGEYITVIPSSEVQDGLEERACTRCPEKESRVIQSINYVDTSFFLTVFDKTEEYPVASEAEFLRVSNAAIFSLSSEAKFILNFDCDDLNALIDLLIDEVTVPFPFSVRARMVGKELTLTFTHGEEPTTATNDQTPYVQLASANYMPLSVPTRGTDYDGFKINNSAISYPVSTSEQLYYALECRVKPIPEAGSSAERLYGKMKAVLRQIITDDMTDFEKARAIYDWLIMNVIYDGELYDLLVGNPSLDSAAYNGFYLEGVFDDGFAVCDGISKAYAAMANIEGIPCVQVIGRQAANPAGVGHAWNKIYLDGSWYIVDATSGGIIVNATQEVYSLQFFLMTDADMAAMYTAENHTALKCETEYNPFAMKKVSGDYDFYIESQAELNAIISCFSDLDGGTSVQIKFADSFDVGGDPMDEIRIACLLAQCSFSGSLTDGENGEIITLW